MHRKMEELGVATTSEGFIDITQPAGHQEDSVIRVHPDQVELLTKWLEEARAELVSASSHPA
jgi:hypothetical protein